MTSKLLFYMILLLTLCCSINTVNADVIYPGEKQIINEYQISNINDYPNYIFILHGTPNPTLQVLNSSKFSFYKLSTCSIYAVPKNEFNQVHLDQMNQTEVDIFLSKDPKVASSNLKLEGLYSTVEEGNPLQSALVVLQINSIRGKQLDIQKTKIIFSYASGQNVEKEFQYQNQTPDPSAPSSYNSLYYLILPLLALLTIIIILLRRSRN